MADKKTDTPATASSPKDEAAPKLSPVMLWAPDHPNGCHIALLNGHTFLVPHDLKGIEVPKQFRKEAIARGCLPVGMAPEERDAETFNRDVLIRAKMRAMMDSDDPNYFTQDGKPYISVLNRLCGFTVERSELNRLWAEVENSILVDKPDTDDE